VVDPLAADMLSRVISAGDRLCFPKQGVSPELDLYRRNCDTVIMKNITVSVDDKAHQRARIRAAERGTSLSALVRDFLTRFAGEMSESDRRKQLQRDTLASIKSFKAGDRLSRDAVHERDALR
jgi:plasmid stability protein